MMGGATVRGGQTRPGTDTRIGGCGQRLEACRHEALYARLYERGLISSGRAAQLLGITRWDFLDLLGRYGVSYFDEAIDQDEVLGRVRP